MIYKSKTLSTEYSQNNWSIAVSNISKKDYKSVLNKIRNICSKFGWLCFVLGYSETDSESAIRVLKDEQNARGRRAYEIIGKRVSPHLHLLVFSNDTTKENELKETAEQLVRFINKRGKKTGMNRASKRSILGVCSHSYYIYKQSSMLNVSQNYDSDFVSDYRYTDELISKTDYLETAESLDNTSDLADTDKSYCLYSNNSNNNTNATSSIDKETINHGNKQRANTTNVYRMWKSVRNSKTIRHLYAYCEQTIKHARLPSRIKTYTQTIPRAGNKQTVQSYRESLCCAVSVA